MCANQTTILTASGGTSYLWDDNSTDPMRTVSLGTYDVTVTDGNTCTDTDSITINQNSQIYLQLQY